MVQLEDTKTSRLEKERSRVKPQLIRAIYINLSML